MLIDTHCHLDFSQFESDRDHVIAQAYQNKVEAMINIGSSIGATLDSMALAAQHAAVFFSIGIHPHYADTFDAAERQRKQLFARPQEDLLGHKKLVAIGEVGLDYYKSTVDRVTQKNTFSHFIDLAQEYDLPLVIHSRESHYDALEILQAKLGLLNNVVFHCFSGPFDFFHRCLTLGAFFSFTGNITYPKATTIREIVKEAPLERIMLETDAPYLAPQQHRGKRNEPAYLNFVAQEVAAIKNISFDEVARQTTQTAKTFFKLDKHRTQL